MNCVICNGNASQKKETKERKFRKEDFVIMEHFYKCDDCGEEFSTPKIDELNSIQVYNQYRAKHHIPFPEEIKFIRDQYNLPASKMADVLGFGINTYRNYEEGEIPSVANAKFILLARDPLTFKKLILNNGISLKLKEKNDLLNRISELLNDELSDSYFELVFNQYTQANEYTGYKQPNASKIKNMFIMFLKNIKAEFADKIKLNKLFYYSDFLHYSNTGYSITGITYRAIPYGQAPSKYDTVFCMCEEEGVIESKYERLMDGSVKQLFETNKKTEDGILTTDELESIQMVIDKFRDTPSWDLVDISHKENSWIDLHINKELISYQKYGFDLKAFNI